MDQLRLSVVVAVAMLASLSMPRVTRGGESEASALVELPRSVLGGSVHSATKVLGSPISTTAEQVENRHAKGVKDEIVTLQYAWGQVAIYRAMVGSSNQLELPFGVTLRSNLPQLRDLPKIGTSRNALEAKLGTPESGSRDSITYQLVREGEGQPDFLTLRFAGDALSEMSWTYDGD